MNKLIATAAIFALATSVAAEQAEQAATITDQQTSVVENNDNSGYYGIINLGESFGSLGGIKSSTVNKKNGFAASAYFGYNINSFFGAELGYLYVQDYKYAIAANLVGKYPLGQGFSVYGKVGAAYVMTKDDGVEFYKKNAFVPAFGAGIDYALPMVDGLHFQIDYYYMDKKKSDKVTIPAQNIASIGAKYLF